MHDPIHALPPRRVRARSRVRARLRGQNRIRDLARFAAEVHERLVDVARLAQALACRVRVARALGAGEVDEGEAGDLQGGGILWKVSVWRSLEKDSTHISLTAVTAHNLDDDHAMATATLAVRERAKDATMKLPQSDDRLRLRRARHPELPQVMDILARRSRFIPIRRRAGLQLQRTTRHDRIRTRYAAALVDRLEQIVHLLVVHLDVRDPDVVLVVSVNLEHS